MCGFAGTLNGSMEKAADMPTLSHRGPNSSGEYQENGFYVRHYRLSIIGAGIHANQPMESLDGHLVVAFNGEIYNYKELAEWLGQPELAMQGDTRVLVEFLAREGVARLNMLNGMFAAAVYNKKSGSLTLIRDRFGVKPLYYVQTGKQVYFASEIKAFARILSLVPDPALVKEYLDIGAYPSDTSTFFPKVKQVRSGSCICFSNDAQEERRFYSLQEECRELIPQKLSYEEYEDLLADSIRLRLRSDVPISLHFSGGTDSTALLLKTKEVWGWDYPLTTFSIGFKEQEYDESALASSYCREINVMNHPEYLSAEEVPLLAEELSCYQDEPYGGIPTIAYFKLNKLERAMGYIVSIEGQGGDEALGGYLSHQLLAMYDLHVSGVNPPLLTRLLAGSELTVTRMVQKAEQLIASGFAAHTDLTDMRDVQGEKPDQFVDWLRTIQLYDILVNKIPRTLRFHDRASMACGREVRFPLLDHRVVAYGLAFEHGMKYSGGVTKAPLRAIIRRHLPKVHNIAKRSVVTPQTHWFQGALKQWVQERVDMLRTGQLLPDKYFRPYDDFFRTERPDNSFYVWQLVNLSLLFSGSAGGRYHA